LAGLDDIIDNERTLRLLSRFGAPQENLIVYNEARHTLEFEKNRREIFSDYLEWLNQLCRKPRNV